MKPLVGAESSEYSAFPALNGITALQHKELIFFCFPFLLHLLIKYYHLAGNDLLIAKTIFTHYETYVSERKPVERRIQQQVHKMPCSVAKLLQMNAELGYFVTIYVAGNISESSDPQEVKLSESYINNRKSELVAFVNRTTNHLSSIPLSEYSLQGCIGTVQPHALSGLLEKAMEAAFKDRRFSKLNFDKLITGKITVTFLHTFEMCRNLKDWIIGTHGIVLQSKLYRNATATYLPSVAVEHNMSMDGALSSLAIKAGIHHEINDDTCELQRYQGTPCTVTFDEFLNHVLANGYTTV